MEVLFPILLGLIVWMFMLAWAIDIGIAVFGKLGQNKEMGGWVFALLAIISVGLIIELFTLYHIGFVFIGLHLVVATFLYWQPASKGK